MAKQAAFRSSAPAAATLVRIPATGTGSLLDLMKDGSEYASIIGAVPDPNLNLIAELRRAVAEIEGLRDRPCLLYIGNVANGEADSAVNPKDDLPFSEMVRAVPPEVRRIDVLLATNGGQGSQIARFVNALRARFDEVDFLLPSFCMSAGTLFALSGDHIWMTPDACLGPIDPQVPNQTGRFVPAQALLLLVEQLQKDGEEALKTSGRLPWSAVRIIDTMDKKDLGDAITASAYSMNLAVEFLVNYKFKNWLLRRTSNIPTTQEYKITRAQEIATALASHDKWKSHGHALSRDVLWQQIQLEIDLPDAALERAIRRAWALCNWMFDKARMQKLIVSQAYSYLVFSNPVQLGARP
jgi:hypothetical protein